jgi:PPOX class probable FMN-dependent enzyme
MSADPPTATRIEDEATLRARWRAPQELVLRKQRPQVDDAAAAFVAASPLMVLATTSAAGTDASPRGGPPGFVRVLDPGRLAFGDLSGNNRLDSYANIVEHPSVGLLFLVPGLEETLRVNGQARVTTDPEVLERTALDAGRPKAAVVVEVTECYVHCGKALRRAGFWDQATWSDPQDRPSSVARAPAARGAGASPGLRLPQLRRSDATTG